MKKVLAILFSMSLVAGALTACGQSTTEPTTEATTESTTEATTETTTEATTETTEATTDAATAKTGLAVITSLESSKPAGAEDGLAQVDSIVAAVLVGEDGKILACNIDAAQTKINFSVEGKLVTDVASTFKSKQELGTEYGLKGSSGIGKEWNEQADAFAAYVVGKTIDEVKGIAVNEEGVATDADLTSSVTIHVGDFISGVEKAVTNAQDMGATSTDALGLAVSTEISDSTDATAEEAGLAQAYSTYSVVTTDADGKITSCYVDMSQSKVNFDTKGVITTDLAVAPQTKQELGDAYGMKKASAIGKEWFEQSNAFAAYVIGKTAEEVSGIAVSEEGLAGDADLVSSVTVHVAPFITIVEKAATSAK